ncbi:MAG TPA: hypothetical protein VKH63_04165 [Candidatus Acidoferrum sp.]|jgi:hypothetical protein|nr:hypothetical protein [Candidatus Acidoferrum sp.]
MPSHPDFALWIVSVLTEAFVCVLIVLRGRLRRYRMLACYFGGCVLVESTRGVLLFHYGIASTHYMYLYFYSDCLLSLLLYFAVVEHFGRVCDSSAERKYVRVGSFLLAVCAGVFCCLVVAQSSARLVTHLVLEYSQNLFSASAALGLGMFVASLRNRAVVLHDRMLAFVLASYLALMLWQYLLRNLYRGSSSFVYTITLLWIMLLLGVAYIFSDPASAKDEPYICL